MPNEMGTYLQFLICINDAFLFFLTAKKVTSVGQVIGGIVAETREIAKSAAKAVWIEYEDLQPRIFSIEVLVAFICPLTAYASKQLAAVKGIVANYFCI